MKLLACDMDGTLLTPSGTFPPGFWELLQDIEKVNDSRSPEDAIVFLPASGRSLPTLRGLFTPNDEESVLDYFLAGNGCVLSSHGEVETVARVEPEVATAVLHEAERYPQQLWVIIHFPERTVAPRDPDFLEFLTHYTTHLDVVDSLHDVVGEDIVNMSVYQPVEPENGPWNYFREKFPQLEVLESSGNWCDIMPPKVDKGTGLEFIKRKLNIATEDTYCFVDYFNDVGLIAPSGTSFAMSNAHPDVKAMCTNVIGSNAKGAVVTTIRDGLENGWL
ncbi:HAD family hydrolase [uncultured Corynebacterium sp.]|uniref:HAD family hydrolase n=1 Tax=uncultured Corynebacterium sp. TaxID=159447 RepID=UPI00261FD10B|nr:HAD family hydrolase [uncultured Corynebacterium sp.]